MNAVEAGLIGRDAVSQLGDVLAGTAQGRQHSDDITIFDSTGLAIQDLAIVLAAIDNGGQPRPAEDRPRLEPASENEILSGARAECWACPSGR